MRYLNIFISSVVRTLGRMLTLKLFKSRRR